MADIISFNDIIRNRDKLLKTKLYAELLNREIPYEQLRDALEKGFEEGEAQWEADLKKYNQKIARVLDEGLKV